MSVDIAAEDLLRNYLQGFLWADDDWLEVDGASATYWQARLAQRTTVEVLPDGRTKWRVRTRVVEGVPAGTDAHQLCLGLNRYAAGWSFAFDETERTIDAIAAMSVPVEWDTFFLRLSEKAKLSAWMSDVFAERLAAAVGGEPAFSHPAAQTRLREKFDGTYYYLQTVRARPEWILDLTRFQFPPVSDTGTTIAGLVGATAEDVEFEGQSFRIPVGTHLHLEAGFARHDVVGDSWRSALSTSCPVLSNSLAATLGAMTWRLFDDPRATLLGGWSHDGDGLRFEQWNTMSEARNQEQLGSWRGGRSVADLWGFTSSLSDVMGAMQQAPLQTDAGSKQDGDAVERAAEIAGAIADQARPAIEKRAGADDVERPADRRLLWLERRRILVVAALFNPAGPTVLSTEICALPDGSEYVVHFSRHPFSPYYRVVGRVGDAGPLSEILTEAMDLMFDSSLPNVMALWEDVEATAGDVPDALRRRVLDVAEEVDTDLVAEAAWIRRTMGNPWEYAAVDQSEADQVKATAGEASTGNAAPDGGFAEWWQQVASTENVIANFRSLPDAWDGALNSLRAFGNLPHFDVDPLLITYSHIGLPAGS